MSHRGRSLTILFTCLMVVTFQWNVVVETLDLAEKAFDDQYLGCEKDTKIKLEENNVLDIENGKNDRLKRAWKEANTIWTARKSALMGKLPEGFEDDHGVALLTYTSFIREDFNNAVKLAGKSYRSYMDDFGFKWLHFYVTGAFQLLLKSSLCGNGTVYSGIDDDIDLPETGSLYVKFGHFLYASLDEEEATIYGNKLLIIDEYLGVNIEDFSPYSAEREVLVPGYEVFTVSPTDAEDVFKLNTTGKFCSNFNCAYINGEKSNLSVQKCMSTAASCGRTPGPLSSVLVSALLLVLLTLL